MDILREELCSGISTLTGTPAENIVEPSIEFLLSSSSKDTYITYQDTVGDVHRVKISNVDNSNKILTRISQKISLCLSNVSLPLNCTPINISVNPSQKRLSFTLEFDIPPSICRSLVSLSYQILDPSIRNYSSTSLTRTQILFTDSQVSTIQFRLLTDDKQLFNNPLQMSSYLNLILNNKITNESVQINPTPYSPSELISSDRETSPSQLTYGLRASKVPTITKVVNQSLEAVLSGFSVSKKQYEFICQSVDVAPKISSGKLHSKLVCYDEV